MKTLAELWQEFIDHPEGPPAAMPANVLETLREVYFSGAARMLQEIVEGASGAGLVSGSAWDHRAGVLVRAYHAELIAASLRILAKGTKQ